eukprot:2528992-Rhodomonas_salina.1
MGAPCFDTGRQELCASTGRDRRERGMPQTTLTLARQCKTTYCAGESALHPERQIAMPSFLSAARHLHANSWDPESIVGTFRGSSRLQRRQLRRRRGDLEAAQRERRAWRTKHERMMSDPDTGSAA